MVDLELPGLFSLKILAWELWLEEHQLRYKYLHWRAVCSVQTLDLEVALEVVLGIMSPGRRDETLSGPWQAE